MAGSICAEKLSNLTRLETEINVRNIALSVVLNISNAFLAAYESTPEQLAIIQKAFEQESKTIADLNALLAENIGLAAQQVPMVPQDVQQSK